MSESLSSPANLLTPSATVTPPTPLTPITPTTPFNVRTAPPTPPLASRDIFFPLCPYIRPSPPVSDSPEQPTPLADPLPPIPTTPYDNALARVQQLNEFLTPSMKCTLSAMLCVVNSHLSLPSTSVDGLVSDPHPLVTSVASEQSEGEIKDLVDIIEKGLAAFAALGGGSSVKEPSEAASPNPPSQAGASTGPRKRQRMDIDGKLISSYRSSKVRLRCTLRDPNCQICNAKGGDVSHIIPYSVKEKKAIDFWKFVELFRGAQATMALKAIALAPNPESVDNLKNVWTLCKTCHDLFGRAKLAIIPDLDGLTYPYDPTNTTSYKAAIEFPCGSEGIGIATWRHEPNGKVRFVSQIDEGDVITLSTNDGIGLPLPHPLLFQLHAIISRVIGLKAAAGFATFPDHERGSPDDCIVPAFTDNSYLHWLEHQAKQPAIPDSREQRYDANPADPHIIRWFKLMPPPPNGLYSSEVVSESDSDPENDHHGQEPHHSEESDSDNELPRGFGVVLSEVGQRMDEKWQLARSRRECYEDDDTESGWVS